MKPRRLSGEDAAMLVPAGGSVRSRDRFSGTAAADGRALVRRLLVPFSLLAGALPLLVTRPAPLMDWPNHVARIHILVGLLHGDAFWARFYRFVGFLVPNTALDLLTYGFTRLGLPVEIAAQLFLGLTYLVFVAGFCALARAMGAWSEAKLGFAILLFYSHALFWGLANYVLGLGLMLGLLAAWIRAAPRPWLQLAIAAGGGAVLLFTHLVTSVLWVAALGCFGLTRLRARAEPPSARIAGAASWVLALLVIGTAVRLLPGGGEPVLDYHYAGATSGIGMVVARKFALFGKLLLGGSLIQDAVSAAALLTCIAVCLFARPSLPRAAGLACLGLLLIALLAPERLGYGSQLDTRLAVVPLLLLAACLRIRPHPMALAALGGAVLLRTLVLTASWYSAGQVFAEYRRQTSDLAPGSMMMMAYGTPLSTLPWQRVWSPTLSSVATQVIAYGLFMPAIFANPAEQPVALRAQYQGLGQPWNLTDRAHLHASAQGLAALCAQHRFPDIVLTELYPGPLSSEFGSAVLHANRYFLILDGCRLKP